WNVAKDHSSGQCIQELFERQVEKNPDAIALVFGQTRLSYAELNARANRLAHHLRELGVRPDSLVALCIERGVDMVVAILAILKAGGAYVPLDLAYPADRVAYMLEDSAPAALVTQGRLLDRFANIRDTLAIVDLDAASPPWADAPTTNLAPSELGL